MSQRHYLCTTLPVVAALLLAGCHLRGTQLPAAAPDFGGRWLPDPQQSDAWPDRLPLTEGARAAMTAFEPDRQDPTTYCMPYGTPRNTLATGSPMEVLQTADRLYFIFQPELLNAETRRVYLTASPVAAPAGAPPTWSGTSRGHWDASTLVVTTDAIEPQAIVSGNGLPHSDQLRVTERWHLEGDAVQGRRLVDELTLEDPQAYTAPLHARRVFRWAPEAAMNEGHCSERLWIDSLWRDRLAEHATAAKRSVGRRAR